MVWLPSLDTFRTFAAENTVRSNHSKSLQHNDIPAKLARQSRLGTRAGRISNCPAIVPGLEVLSGGQLQVIPNAVS
jgi:hypothetical protein